MFRIIIVFGLLLAPKIHADTFEYGILPVVGMYQSNLDHDTEAVTTGNVLSGLLVINTGRSNRWWVNLQYQSLDFDGSVDEIGQEVSGFNVSMIHQWQHRISRHFKPWFGVGLGASAYEYSDRHFTDSQGFLSTTLPDTTEAGFTLELNTTTDLDLFEKLDSGLSLKAAVPINDGVSAIEAGLYIIF